MKMAATVFAVVLILIGCVWLLQGFGVIPGSFMSGQSKWAVNGGIVIAIGIVLFMFSRRMT